jgi:glycosyltransferase involved in cell wall biosynthesis
MPLVLVEAMSHGLAIVTSDIPVSKEILGDFGLYFKNGNIEELAERLEEATQIDWSRKSQEAFEIAKRFDINNIICRWKELIEND